MSFGAKLAEYRKRAGLTQESLAEKIGIQTHHLSDLERGKKRPHLRTLARMRSILNLSEEEMNSLLDDISEV